MADTFRTGDLIEIKTGCMPEDIDIDWDGEDEPPSDYWTGPDDGMTFYITVRNAEISFGTAYDGYWGDADNTLEEAVEQALLGSCLIDESQRKFARAAS